MKFRYLNLGGRTYRMVRSFDENMTLTLRFYTQNEAEGSAKKWNKVRTGGPTHRALLGMIERSE